MRPEARSPKPEACRSEIEAKAIVAYHWALANLDATVLPIQTGYVAIGAVMEERGPLNAGQRNRIMRHVMTPGATPTAREVIEAAKAVRWEDEIDD